MRSVSLITPDESQTSSTSTGYLIVTVERLMEVVPESAGLSQYVHSEVQELDLHPDTLLALAQSDANEVEYIESLADLNP